MTTEGRSFAIHSEADTEQVRREARTLATRQGLGRADTERAALAACELATNLLKYASHGEIRLAVVVRSEGPGVELVSTDRGPGIPDLEAALTDGFSTGGGLGSGLPAVRRLADEFAIASTPAGTRIEVRVWRPLG